MRQTVQKKNNFYGVTVSPFGVRNGFVDYGTLMELAGPVKEFHRQECEYDIWELVNGDDILYTDTEGITYTDETRIERIAELKALISQTESEEKIQKYQCDIQTLNIGELAGPVKEFHRQECEYDIWELVNGDDILYTDTEGITYTDETRIERIAELKALISQTENKEKIQKYQCDIQTLNIGVELSFFQYLEVPWQFAQILQDESDEVLYYLYQTDMYVWAEIPDTYTIAIIQIFIEKSYKRRIRL